MISQRKMKKMTRSTLTPLARVPQSMPCLLIAPLTWSLSTIVNIIITRLLQSPILRISRLTLSACSARRTWRSVWLALVWFEKNLIFYQPKVFNSFSTLLKSLALLLGPTPHLLWLDWNWYKPGGTSDQTNHLRFSILHVLRKQRHILRQSHSHTVRAGRSRGCKRQAGEGILIPGRKI